MPATHIVVGANTSSGAVVTAKVSGPATLTVSTDPSFNGAVSIGPVSPSGVGRARFIIDGLQPNSQQYYRVQVDGEDEFFQGQFRTTPVENQASNWTVAAASCAGTLSEYPGVGDVLNSGRISNHPVFNAIASTNPTQFVHMGDIHYYDIGSGVHVPIPTSGEGWESTFRRAWDDVLTQPNQQLLYANVATPYFYDDHDFGPNDSDGTSAGRDYVTRAYRDYWPHYPLEAGSGSEPIYQSWMMGRVLWMALDVRADRSPNAALDTEEKGMLGEAQLAWIRSTLATTQAQALVLVSGSQWIRSGADTWSRFEYERQRLLGILEETGFLGRMIIVSGDTHELAIDTGSNSRGNIPVFQFASLDSNHSANPSNIYDTGPSRPGRGQWGRISCIDTGSAITLIGECMVMNTVWRTHRVTWEFEDDNPPPPIDVIPPPATSVITDGMQWQSFSSVTGDLLDDIPEVTSGKLRSVIGSHSDAQLSLPLPLADRHISRERIAVALAAKRSVLVAVANQTPIWSGWVMNTRIGTESDADIDTVTPEAYLSHRYIQKDYNFVDRDFAEVIRIIVAENCGPINGVGQGFRFLVDAPNTGKTVSIEYEASTHKSVRSILDELMAMDDGPEWTVRTMWRDATHRSVDWVIEVRDNIGLVTPVPEHQWEIGAQSVFDSTSKSDARYSLSEVNSDGKGANVVVAYSTGEGESKPRSDYQIDHATLSSGIPIIEHHWQPASDIPDVEDLNSYAKGRLELTKHGLRLIELEARYDAYPRIGYDWNLGDTVGWALYGHGHPSGLIGSGRVMGYTVDIKAGTVEPILWNPEDDM